jgi:hypothetical protein
MPIDETIGKEITCPFCEAKTCRHLLAVVDMSFNEWWEETGYAWEHHRQFYDLIEDTFRRSLKSGLRVLPLTNPELAELWNNVLTDYSGIHKTALEEDQPDVALDSSVVNRLIIELMRDAGAIVQDSTDGYAPGFVSSMRVLYAKNPKTVFGTALENLNRLLS